MLLSMHQKKDGVKSLIMRHVLMNVANGSIAFLLRWNQGSVSCLNIPLRMIIDSRRRHKGIITSELIVSISSYLFYLVSLTSEKQKLRQNFFYSNVGGEYPQRIEMNLKDNT